MGRRGAAGRGAGDERAAVCPQRAPPPQEPGLGLGGGPGCGTARRAGPVVRGLPRSRPAAQLRWERVTLEKPRVQRDAWSWCCLLRDCHLPNASLSGLFNSTLL